MLVLKTEQILGTPNGDAWSQVYHHFPQDELKRQQRGELVLLISIKERIKNKVSLGKELIVRFNEEYFGNLEGRPMQALEKALKKVGKEKLKYFSSPENISLMTLVLWQDIVYLGIWQNGKIILRRDKKTIDMLECSSVEKLKVISGPAEDKDLFLLATTDFIERVPEGMVKASLSVEDLEVIGETLMPVVHAQEKQGALAAVFVQLFNQKKEKSLPVKKTEHFLFKIVDKFRTKFSGLLVAIVFLILLIISVFWGWRNRQKQQRLEKVKTLTAQIEENINTAENVRNLDPESSLKIVDETSLLVDELEKLDKEKSVVFQQKIDTLKENLGNKEIKPEVFYDLSLIADNVQADVVFSDGEKALILDKQNKRVVSVNLGKKSGEIIAGGEITKNLDFLVFSGSRNYGLNNGKIYLLEDERFQEIKDFEEGLDVIGVGGWLGNLYVLDKKAGQLWKYPAISEGLGGARAWFRDEPTFISDTVDMAINGNVWFLESDGRIHKYLSGRPDEFNQELPSGVGITRFLAVARDAEKIAFWDEKEKMVWVFSKQGSFLSRISVNLDNVVDLIFSPEGDKIFLVEKKKIYVLNV